MATEAPSKSDTIEKPHFPLDTVRYVINNYYADILVVYLQ
jgi:hypothetical protein